MEGRGSGDDSGGDGVQRGKCRRELREAMVIVMKEEEIEQVSGNGHNNGIEGVERG